ncbi:MAG: YbhB/YbcL family Raf kinase inhibitor-like protein [Burkholderiaceae bacterium]
MRKQLFCVAAFASLPMLAHAFEITSADIAPNKPIPQKFAYNGFGCTGNNISPQLSWKNPPAGTKSFALLVDDPDAPNGGAGFWHWIVVNLPVSVVSLPQGAGTAEGKGLLEGAWQIPNDFGTPGWGGPCPPAGAAPHHYRFTVYALKVDKLDLPANATASLTGFQVNANAIGKATFTGLYGR